MRIQKFGMDLSPDRELFHRVLMDIERRNLPDIGMFVTFNSGVRWNNEVLETLSCKLPEEGRDLHFAIVLKKSDEDERLPAELNVLLVQTKNDGTNAEPVWHQLFPADVKKVGNVSFEVVRMFLNCTAVIKSPREGVELMYPAYDLPVPLSTELPGLHGNPKAAIPVPDVTEESDSGMRPSA